MERGKKIVKISVYGIIVNLILVIFKALVGIIANSISVILDAVNNLSDAFSSIVTIIGIKLSEKRPDKKHPFGHGRIEYLSAIIIATAVLVAGVISFKESIEKIITPTEANYSIITLTVIIVAVLVKLFFGRFVKRQGEKLNSGSLVASGVDAISDSAISFSVFIGAIISYFWHISLDGYLGILISVMIIKTALEIMKKGIDDMVGIRVDDKIVSQLKNIILKDKEVLGVYDVAVHNYGPNKMVASAHIQVDDELKAKEIHRLTRKISMQVFEKMGIAITIGIYASNEVDEFKRVRKSIDEILSEYKNLKEIHGFYVDEKKKTVSFDLVFKFDEKEPEKRRDEILEKLKKKYPQFKFSIILDSDISG